ncbi:MAG: DsrE/DsrF/DrsH-like family protein [Candidatus Marsarchaeota archaeon]|nr:DsrE/DsrF/DrsH-like family protein [Candidatus Marsarchaeota archaeon]
MAKNRLSIIIFSGTLDKFIPLGALAIAGTAMGMEVNVFVTGFAVLAFRKSHMELPFPSDFENLKDLLLKGMEKNNISWREMLEHAKVLGMKVYACSMMSAALDLTEKDYDPIIDGISGAASFLADAAGSQTIFI